MYSLYVQDGVPQLAFTCAPFHQYGHRRGGAKNLSRASSGHLPKSGLPPYGYQVPNEAFFIFFRHDNTDLRNAHRTIKHHHHFSTNVCPSQQTNLFSENLPTSASRDIFTNRKSHIRHLKWPVERENPQAARQDRKKQQARPKSRTVQRLVFRSVADLMTSNVYPGGFGEGRYCIEGVNEVARHRKS